MSQENVEIVRRAIDAYNRGDLGAFLESFDEEVVIRAAEGWPETAYHGKREVRSFYEGLAGNGGRRGGDRGAD
jgi:hypothetical protein